MQYKLSELKDLIDNMDYGSKSSELIKDGKGIRINADEYISSDYYDDYKDSKPFIMAGYSRNYNFNETDIDKPDSLDELKKIIAEKYDPMAILPLYIYEHGGIALSTTPFSCSWDSGQLGYVFMTKKQALEMGIDNELDAKKSIKDGVEYMSRLNQENLYSIEFFNVEYCKCCNTAEEKDHEYIATCFYDELKDELIANIGKDNIDIDN